MILLLIASAGLLLLILALVGFLDVVLVAGDFETALVRWDQEKAGTESE